MKYLSEIRDGYFRGKIWHWIKYTSMQHQEPVTDENANRKGEIDVNVKGYIKTTTELMSSESVPLRELACDVLVSIG